MLKRILVVLLVVLSGLSLSVVTYEADDAEREAIRAAIEDIGEPLVVPAKDILSDPDIFWPILKDAAVESGVNLFRAAHGYDDDGKPFVTYYALLTSKNTDFYEPFRLRSGRLLSPSDTQDTRNYLSTTPSDDPDQIGVLEDIGHNDNYSICSLQRVFDSYPTAGNYTLEAKSPEDAETFFERLAEGLTASGADIRVNNLKPQGWHVTMLFAGIAGGFELTGQTALWLAVIAVAVMVIYHQLYESKRTAVLLLYGNNILQCWSIVSGRLLAAAMGALLVASTAVSLLIPGTTTGLVLDAASQLLVIAAIVLAASLLTLPYIATMVPHEALKNRKDTYALLIFNIVVKCALSLLLVYMGTIAVGRYAHIQEERTRLSGWQETSQYGVFYPLNVGLDGEEQSSDHWYTQAAETIELYPVLNGQGALFIEADQFASGVLELEEQHPEYRSEYRSIKVNPNYLDAYPVMGTDGKPVTLSEDEADWVLLVPESYRAQENRIVKYFSDIRTGAGGGQTTWSSDRFHFGRTTESEQREQQVRIIWTGTGQRVFSFDPNVYPEDGNRITDPIIEVMTLGNSSGYDRFNGFSGGEDSSLKVRLTDGDSAKTYAALKGTLEELALDDNLRHLVTMNEYAAERLQELNLDLAGYLSQMAALLLVFLILAIQSATLVFEQYARRVAARKLLGYGFFSRHRQVFFLLVGGWALTAAAAVAVVFVVGLPEGYQLEDPASLFGVAGVFLVIEAAASALAVWFVESRRIVNVLKGEF